MPDDPDFERVKQTSLADLVRFAAASDDFNPIHYDLSAAREAGLEGVILPGLLKAGWLSDLGVSAMSHEWDLVEFEVSYRGLDYVGEASSVGGLRTMETDAVTELRLWSRDDAGVQTTVGHARFLRAGNQS